MQAYWPFHRGQCYRNEFADAVEGSEPKFARWMRKHAKLAVLKDDEVDRLERAAAANTGYTRQEVMESMYNRLEPKPKGKRNHQQKCLQDGLIGTVHRILHQPQG